MTEWERGERGEKGGEGGREAEEGVGQLVWSAAEAHGAESQHVEG